MTLSRRQLLTLHLRGPAPRAPSTTDPDLHLLNRTTWGPRPEELARIVVSYWSLAKMDSMPK